jgi:hypothetical protein
MSNAIPLAWSLVFLAEIHIFLRDAAGVAEAGAEPIYIARQHRFAQWLAWAQEQRGWALCQLGDTGRVWRCLRRACTASTRPVRC